MMIFNPAKAIKLKQTIYHRSGGFRQLQSLKAAAGFLMAWGFVNILLNLRYPAPQESLILLLRVSPEALWIIAILCVASWLNLPRHHSLLILLTLIVVFLRLFRSADELVPMYFFRPFNLYIDAQFLPVLVRLLYKTMPLKTFYLYSAAGIFLIAAITAGVWWSLKSIHRTLSRQKKAWVMVTAVVAVLAAALLANCVTFSRPLPIFQPGISQRIVEEIDFILHVRGYRTQNMQTIGQATAQIEQMPSSLDKLNGADVYIVFIESYGQTVYDNQRHFRMISPVIRQYEKELADEGFEVRSGFFKSPAFGGSSWLAHGSIASGVNLSNQLVYDLLITSEATTIAPLFEKAGYRTISVMPANELPWPQGKFFGYQKHYYAQDFNYKGPRFGWSPMSDQYVLETIYRKEIQPRSQPLFIEFVLISSHAPFHRQPPYIEDWSQIGDGRIYYQRETVSFPVVWPDLTNAAEAYVTAMIYEITIIKNFIEQYVNDDTLIIIMGDHQPNVQITGPDSSWSVPVHVIGRNKLFLEAFESNGFSPGLIPQQLPPHPGMETFLPHFLEAFSTN
ncbi:MAG: sulfatase-like hydrolase/transferase [Desulfobacterales bacterium]|nr:sulfatase-like hydrolase/transferase [Desulfobacterales bacterium]